jgi:hypothetical protein
MQTGVAGMIFDPCQHPPKLTVSVKQPSLVVAAIDVHMPQQQKPVIA